MNCFDFIFGKSVDEKEADYIKKYGYPDESVVFTDNTGRISRIIGKNEFIRAYNSEGYQEIVSKIFKR